MTQLKFKSAPLPFQGQKRNFITSFAREIATLPDNTIFVDLFGGSGLLSRTAKDIKPNCRVIYNDYDNYSQRINAIPTTNKILSQVRPIIKTKNEIRLSSNIKNKVLDIIYKYDCKGYVDYLTLSSNLLFSMSCAKSLDDFAKRTLYNRICKNSYICNTYLDGLEIVHCDYSELLAQYSDDPNVIFLCDPPYLSTDVKAYDMFWWQLKDYLNIMTALNNTKFIFFTSERSQLIELYEWLGSVHNVNNPFDTAKFVGINVTLNKGLTKYREFMVVKVA